MDDHKLKELLSAWFDGELDSETAAEVSAYVERSDEAKRIVNGFRQLKQLSDQSALNPNSDYWERAAAKIEAAIPAAGGTITPIRRSGWSDWGWRIVSLAASLVLLTYVGFHSEDILDRIREPESSDVSESVIQKKAAEDKSIQMLKPEVRKNKKDDVDLQLSVEPRVENEVTPPPEPPAKEVTEADRQRIAPTPLKEVSTDEAEESAIEKVQDYKAEETRGLTSERSSLQETSISDSVSVSAPAFAPPPVIVGKARTGDRTTAGSDLDEETITNSSDINLAAKAPEPVLVDSTREPTQEERYQYLWDHVIAHQLTAIQALEMPEYGFDGGGLGFSSGLTSNGKKSTVKSSGKREKSDERALERERELIDAAFYMGSRQDKGRKLDGAKKYLKYMALDNESTLDKGYAGQKYAEIKDLR